MPDFIMTDGTVTVDMSILQDLAGDDVNSIRPIIELFLTNMPETIQKMEEYHQAKDWQELSKMAHYAKSSLSVINIDTLYDLCGKVEKDANTGTELENIGALIYQVHEKYKKAELLLKKELNKLSA